MKNESSTSLQLMIDSLSHTNKDDDPSLMEINRNLTRSNLLLYSLSISSVQTNTNESKGRQDFISERKSRCQRQTRMTSCKGIHIHSLPSRKLRNNYCTVHPIHIVHYPGRISWRALTAGRLDCWFCCTVLVRLGLVCLFHNKSPWPISSQPIEPTTTTHHHPQVLQLQLQRNHPW